MLTQVLVLQDLYFNNLIKWKDDQGSRIRPVTGNRRPPVPVYRSGLAGYRSEPVEFKFEFKLPRSTGSDRYAGRLDRYTGRFGRYTGRFGW